MKLTTFYNFYSRFSREVQRPSWYVVFLVIIKIPYFYFISNGVLSVPFPDVTWTLEFRVITGRKA